VLLPLSVAWTKDHDQILGALPRTRGPAAGRLPVTLALVPTAVGERVWLCCPIGVCAEDIADEADRLRAACFAREIRITRDRRFSALVVVEVIRRDPLAATAPIPSPLGRFDVPHPRHSR
jgi:hypothetical protein